MINKSHFREDILEREREGAHWNLNPSKQEEIGVIIIGQNRGNSTRWDWDNVLHIFCIAFFKVISYKLSCYV